MQRVTRSMVAVVCAIAAVSPILSIAQQNPNAKAVFVMTNSADKNQVIAFERGTNGTLSYRATYDTAGRGSGGSTTHCNRRALSR